jgi:hypothetical protein
MELKSMLLPEKVVTFDFPGCKGFTVDLAYLSKERVKELHKKCMKTKIDSRTRQPLEEFDDEQFLDLYVRSVIKDWKGFKIKYLHELVLAETNADPEEEIEYTPENALDLMQSSTIFDNWVNDVTSDLGNFSPTVSKKKLEELKVISEKVEAV